jgi:hypothetical protein
VIHVPSPANRRSLKIESHEISMEEESKGRFLVSITGEIRNRGKHPVL